MQELLDQLGNIFEVLKKENVAPPISDEEYERLAGRLPFKIPSVIESLYRWHNGVDQFMPAYDLLSLSDAIAQYEELIAFREEFQDGAFFSENYLPILQFQDSYFLADCKPNSDASIYYLWIENGTMRKRYENLEQIFQSVIDAYLSRAYYMEDGLLMENPVLLRKIERNYLAQDQQNERNAEWNKLCDELQQLRRNECSQEQSSEEAALEALHVELLGLASPKELQKDFLIQRLSETHDERAIDYMMEFLNDKNPKIIVTAAYGLGKLRAREKLPELLKLSKHPAETVRNLSTHAIAEIITSDDELLLQPLLALLADESDLVRIAAIQALGQLKKPIAVPPLINLLQAKSSGIRYYTIQALGKIGDIRAIERLQQQQSKVLPEEAQLIEQAIRSIEKANL